MDSTPPLYFFCHCISRTLRPFVLEGAHDGGSSGSQVPSTSCAQECPDPEPPQSLGRAQGAPGPRPAPLSPTYPRPHMGRSRVRVFWKTKKRTKAGEWSRRGGVQKAGADRRNHKIPRQVRNREQGSGNKVYPSGCSNTPTTDSRPQHINYRLQPAHATGDTRTNA